jgi:hypothetical protein
MGTAKSKTAEVSCDGKMLHVRQRVLRMWQNVDIPVRQIKNVSLREAGRVPGSIGMLTIETGDFGRRILQFSRKQNGTFKAIHSEIVAAMADA